MNYIWVGKPSLGKYRNPSFSMFYYCAILSVVENIQGLMLRNFINFRSVWICRITFRCLPEVSPATSNTGILREDLAL